MPMGATPAPMGAAPAGVISLKKGEKIHINSNI
jgi:hypothetical protein